MDQMLKIVPGDREDESRPQRLEVRRNTQLKEKVVFASHPFYLSVHRDQEPS